MELMKWSPKPWFGFPRRFNSLFDEFFAPEGRLASEDLYGWRPAVDIFDADDKLVIKAELPGVDKKNISVDVKDGVLTIRGERSEEKSVEEKNYHHKERLHGSFERCFTLSRNVDPEKISAEYIDGVLKVEVPKPEDRLTKRITVH